MYWQKSDLDSSISTNDRRLANYFDTFGFIVIRDFLNSDEYRCLADEYDEQYRIRTGGSNQKDGMQFLPNFVDSSRIFTDHFFSKQMQKVYRYFAGEDFLYLGSDGSRFITTSFPWHRDWFTRIPILKFNFYFNRHHFEGGKFLVIPGSNFVGDSYAGAIQKAMSWPMQNKNPSGLAENGWLPDTKNPRAPYLQQIYGNLPNVPHVELTLNQGDVVIFDHRAVHCVQTTQPEVPRSLLTVLLSKNAFEMQHPQAAVLMREIVDLVVSERNHIGCAPYGTEIYAHDFSKSKHFVSIEKRDSDSFNIGRFTGFESVLDFDRYAAIGKAYRAKIEGNPEKQSNDRLAQSYGYGDVHLGINAQNIDG